MPVAAQPVSLINSLRCSACQKKFDIHSINTFASCDQCQHNPIVAEYDLLTNTPKDFINSTERSLWRYRKFLPVLDDANIVTLGEGWTPMLHVPRLANEVGLNDLFLKDESLNPTGSFKARGLSLAVSKAKELGVTECIIPTAGNAGGAMAAYCARAGMKATVVMPKHTPRAFKTECQYFGASVIEVDGLISDCAKKVAELNADGHLYDVSTMKEPYRLEGKKTLGYEIAEQLNWQLPDVIVYPTGGGTGLIGIWKAIREMMVMGWIHSSMPRFIAVQSEHCQPVVSRFYGAPTIAAKSTIANGLAVPFPFASDLIHRVLSETCGSAMAVSEEEIMEGVKNIASKEGLLVSPEGGALFAALKKLRLTNEIHEPEKVILLNTGVGYKYIENY